MVALVPWHFTTRVVRLASFFFFWPGAGGRPVASSCPLKCRPTLSLDASDVCFCYTAAWSVHSAPCTLRTCCLNMSVRLPATHTGASRRASGGAQRAGCVLEALERSESCFRALELLLTHSRFRRPAAGHLPAFTGSMHRTPGACRPQPRGGPSRGRLKRLTLLTVLRLSPAPQTASPPRVRA